MGPRKLDLGLLSQVLRSKMETLSQHLKKYVYIYIYIFFFYPKKKIQTKDINLHKYLDELMEVTPHNLIGRHPQEYFHVINTKNILSTCQGNPNINPDTRRSGVSLLFLLIPSPWFLMPRSKLLH